MSRPTFFHGVIVAAVLGFFASAVVAALLPFVGTGAVLRLAIPALGLAYLLFLFSRRRERVGRVTTLACWSTLAVTAWWFAPPLPLFFLVHVAAIWLVRSLYFYSGVLPALMDLGLCALSVSATVWAATRSGSVFLATWCFFLVQALFVSIPPAVKRPRPAQRTTAPGDATFENARHRADEALRQLFTQ